jgi:nitric oxide reductase NorQ protein
MKIFSTCHAQGLPLLLKGPTGAGKSRFVENMAWRLKRPLITVACHDDLSASDLTGRYLIRGSETVWVDGPLTHAARIGAICYLDELVEARQDTTVVVHPLTDDRRVLPIEKTGELAHAAPGFLLVVLQPGLPASDQGSQTEHSAALRDVGIRLPAGEHRARDRDARGRSRSLHGASAGGPSSSPRKPSRR